MPTHSELTPAAQLVRGRESHGTGSQKPNKRHLDRKSRHRHEWLPRVRPRGRFTEAVPHPHVTVTSAGMLEKALALHDDAHAACFIASSVNFPVRHQPVVTATSKE
jgi:organic hydroperoxide reductase OsmC/OhrA